MRHWCWYFLGSELNEDYDWPDMKQRVRSDDIGRRFVGMESGDELIVYVNEDYSDIYDGEITPGDGLYEQLMALVLMGKAQLIEVGD